MNLKDLIYPLPILEKLSTFLPQKNHILVIQNP